MYPDSSASAVNRRFCRAETPICQEPADQRPPEGGHPARWLAAQECVQPVAEVASHALSQAVSILFVTLALTQVASHLGDGGRASLIRAAFSALACLTRYMGASVVLAVVQLLLAARVAPREKMKRIAVYTLIAAAPVGLWMLRNFLLAGSTTGERGSAFYAFPSIADEVLRIAVGDWWLVGLTGPVLLALVMAAGHALRRCSDRKSDAPVVSDVAWGPLRMSGSFSLAYLTLLVAAMMLGAVSDGWQWDSSLRCIFRSYSRCCC